MYVRPPNTTSERIKIPENYRGNAFGSSGEYTDMPPPIRLPHASYDLPPEESRESQRQKEIDEARQQEERQFSLPHTTPNIASPTKISEDDIKPALSLPHAEETAKNPIFSSLLPPTNHSAHFPFGHGIGTEELLILGMMLLIFTHGSELGESDNELILLLALLLFSG